MRELVDDSYWTVTLSGTELELVRELLREALHRRQADNYTPTMREWHTQMAAMHGAAAAIEEAESMDVNVEGEYTVEPDAESLVDAEDE